MTLPESIVCEIQLNRRKYFFSLIDRSPSQTSDEFDTFMDNFELMLSRMSAEEPYCVIITGDFNCGSPQWWENERENDEGRLFKPFTSELGLQQLICEPTHFIGESKSCIDLIFTNQPNLFLETGVHPTLHERCHHHIVFVKITANNLAPPPYNPKFWYYERANIPAIRRSIELYDWQETFQELQCPNLQVRTLNEVLSLKYTIKFIGFNKLDVPINWMRSSVYIHPINWNDLLAESLISLWTLTMNVLQQLSWLQF